VPGRSRGQFDRGGEGVGYHDNVKGNAGGQFSHRRGRRLILSYDSTGGVMSSTILKPASGSPTRSASPRRDSTTWICARAAPFHSAVFISRSMPRRDGPRRVPHTAAGPIPVVSKRVALTAGPACAELVADQLYFNLHSVPCARCPGADAVFRHPRLRFLNVRGRNFDRGGEGVAYHDMVPGQRAASTAPAKTWTSSRRPIRPTALMS